MQYMHTCNVCGKVTTLSIIKLVDYKQCCHVYGFIQYLRIFEQQIMYSLVQEIRRNAHFFYDFWLFVEANLATLYKYRDGLDITKTEISRHLNIIDSSLKRISLWT